MRSTIKSAKTVDEAVRQGIKDLGLSLDSVEIEILEEPKTGFLGLIGSRDAIVKITEKEELTIDVKDIFSDKKKDLVEAKEEPKEPEKQAAPKRQGRAREEAVIKEKKQDKPVSKAKRPDSPVRENPAKDSQIKAQAKVNIDQEVKSEEAKRPMTHDDSQGQDKSAEAKASQEKPIEKQAKEVQESKPAPQVDQERLELAKADLEKLLEQMHIKASVEADIDDRTLVFNLVDISEEDTGIVIGRKGETLDSLQYILSLMANKDQEEYLRVSVNVANYRQRRKEAIENNARKVAFKVIKSKRSMSLEPMNAYERRIVHYALQNYKEVETVSQGNFPNRKVVIKYKD